MAAPPNIVTDKVSSAPYAQTITPSDVTTFVATRGLYVGVAGNLTVTMAGDGAEQVFLNVAVGEHPFSVTQVKAATTAGSIVAMW